MPEKLYIKYEYAKQMLQTELEILLHSFSMKHGYTHVEHIKSRMKTNQSIEKKLRNKNIPFSKENIEKYIVDVIGFRIVVSFLSDVYDIVSLIANSTNIIIKERKDYIRTPKESGYTSYHVIVLSLIHI